MYVSATLRAFTNFTGIVVENCKMMAGLLSLFTEFATIFDLRLNLPKTVLISLCPTRLVHSSNVIRDDMPHSPKITLPSAAIYLGIWMGPEACDHCWLEVGDKLFSRVHRWCHSAWGYTTSHGFGTPTSPYSSIAELNSSPHQPHHRSRLLSGSCSSLPDIVRLEELFHLTYWFLLQYNFASLHHTALVARLRITKFEDMQWSSRLDTLRNPHIDGHHIHANWLCQLSLPLLRRHHQTLRRLGPHQHFHHQADPRPPPHPPSP